jgi:hypothetical protein
LGSTPSRAPEPIGAGRMRLPRLASNLQAVALTASQHQHGELLAKKPSIAHHLTGEPGAFRRSNAVLGLPA